MKYKRRIIALPDDERVDDVAKKPRKCPHCDGAVYRILYGMPVCNEEEYFRRYGRHVIFGGCCLSEDNPDWGCVDCGRKFRKVPMKL